MSAIVARARANVSHRGNKCDCSARDTAGKARKRMRSRTLQLMALPQRRPICLDDTTLKFKRRGDTPCKRSISSTVKRLPRHVTQKPPMPPRDRVRQGLMLCFHDTFVESKSAMHGSLKGSRPCDTISPIACKKFRHAVVWEAGGTSLQVGALLAPSRISDIPT